MELMWNIVDLFVNFVETFVIYRYMDTYFDGKYKTGNRWIWIIAVTILSFLILSSSDNIAYKLVLCIIILLFLHMNYKGKIVHKTIRLSCLLAVIFGIENITVIALVTLFNKPVSIFAANNAYRLLAIVIAKFLIYIFVIWLGKRKGRRVLELQSKPLFLALVVWLSVIIITIMILILKIYETTDINDDYVAILVFGFAVLCFQILGVYQSIIKQAEEQMDINLSIQQKELQYKYATDIETSIEEMKRIRHDFANHMMCIIGYIELNHYDKLEEYVRELSNPIESSNDIIIAGHPAISSMIYSKTLLAKKENIVISIETDIAASINISDIDLCVVVGNVMDNAIEACMKLEKDNREIKLLIKTKSDYFLFDCMNNVDTDTVIREDNVFKTNKKDKSIHGIGLRNVQTVAYKYKGEMKVDTHDNLFRIKLTLMNKIIE